MTVKDVAVAGEDWLACKNLIYDLRDALLRILERREHVLTQWFVQDDEDGRTVAETIVREISWLRKPGPDGERTHAELLANG